MDWRDAMAKRLHIPSPSEALPGREEALELTNRHFVLGTPLRGPFAVPLRECLFGLGCFWGAERMFWQLAGVYSTSVGYAGGYTRNPSYEEVCSGKTGHSEVVRVVYDSGQIEFAVLLRHFWEAHDPTQGMRQGNDLGTQYRSMIICSAQDQVDLATLSLRQYQVCLSKGGFGLISTEIQLSDIYYFAEDYHQQYLAKNPNGYCGLGGCGVKFLN